MRIDLGTGQWAELRDRLSYAQARDVRRAFVASQDDRALLVDLDIALCRAYVASWTVLDTEGHAVPIDAIESAPDDIIQAITAEALQIWNGKADPKDTSGTSPSTLRALG